MEYDDFSRMEWTVLTCFWSVNKAMTAKELSEKFNLNQCTVLIIIRKLIKVEILEVDNYVMSGKRLARSFRTKVKEKDLLTNSLNSVSIINLTRIWLRRLDSIEDCDFLLEIIKAKREKSKSYT